MTQIPSTPFEQRSPVPPEIISRTRIEATPFGDLLLIAADRSPDKDGIVFGDDRRSYAKLAANAMKIARGLRAVGVRHGDHVGLLLPNGFDFVEAFFGIALCGAVSVLINARYRPGELTYVVENADVVTVITTGMVADNLDFAERLTAAFPTIAESADPMRLDIADAPRLRNIVLLGNDEARGCINHGAFLALAENVSASEVHAARVMVRVRDIGMILYTSGTSSNPKGCLITHEALVRSGMNLAQERWQYGPDEKVWSPLPLFHCAALSALMSSIHMGNTFIGHDRFDPGESLNAIDREKVTVIFLPFVTFLQAMMHHPDFGKTDFSHVKVMNSCFAAMPSRVGEVYAEAMPDCTQVGTYGLTEGTGVVATGGPGMENPELGFTRLGYPLLGLEVRIVDLETGKSVPTGQHGEILMRGYAVFEGYYKDADRTAEALPGDGWCHTGDIGSIDENGHMMFHGRMKDMLKVGGENVASAEVESVLTAYPGVKLAQVVGLPDERLAEIPAAFVELASGAQVSAEDLLEHCRPAIASFKIPRHIRFVDSWPMSASKIQKFRLRHALMEELGISEL